MTSNNIGLLQEKRRTALLDYCIGQVRAERYPPLRTPEDLFELLRIDPLDSARVQTSGVAEAISCAQQYISAVYNKMEPGFENHEFPPEQLENWALYNNYSDWAAVQMIALYPENYINPFVRQRKTDLFKTLENNLNQARLNTDSVQAALQDYLQAFEQICDLDVVSGYMDGTNPERADYYFVGRQRVPPFQYFWRKAQIEITPTCRAVNPAAWSEWKAVDIQPAGRVLDIRPVIWNGRLCLVWAEWRDKVGEIIKTDPPDPDKDDKSRFVPHQLDINVAFMRQNGQWSAPLNLRHREFDEDLSAGARLIATVWVDPQIPKGKLGVLLVNDKTGTGALKEIAIIDVLMRPVTGDSGNWLELANTDRFVSALTVQHPLGLEVTVVSSESPSGSMAAFLGLNVFAMRVNDNDVLTVEGFCRSTGLPGIGKTAFTLQLELATVNDPEPVKSDVAIAGDWTMAFLKTFTRPKGTWKNVRFTLKNDTEGFGGKQFDLKIVDLSDFLAPTLLKNTTDAAQFLDFQLGAGWAMQYVRLNSLFGPELVTRSTVSPATLINWDSQHLSEPPPAGVDFEERNGAFDGANGLFFWELFFHLPHLIATRLRDEERFAEAQTWLHFVFDPRANADSSTVPEKPNYWRCRPLINDLGNVGCEAVAPADPDAIGYSAPVHLRLLMFIEYVKNLMAWGDWHYRQLTRESLVAAKLCYVQAGSLMGKPPLTQTVNLWQTATLKDLLAQSCTRTALETFEQTLNYSLADVPAGSDRAPMLGMLGCPPFRAPINDELFTWFNQPQDRMNNLRNNLTIDGKPMLLPLFNPPTDPNQLLRALAAGGVGGARPMGGRLVVIAFRWRVIFEVALRAVQALQDYGSQVLNLLERRDRAEQEELQQNHLVELGNYAKTVQEQSIAQLEASMTALEQSRAVARERADAYAARYDENVSAVEYQVMANLDQSKELALAAKILKPVGVAFATAPNIFGMANGGFRIDKVTDAICFGLEIASSMLQIDADKQATTEGYRRRRNEWGLQRDQALAEIAAIDAQIVAQSHAIDAARTNLAQTLRANAQALTMYNYLKKRATNAELFGWMLGQLKALHYQAYDAVVSLCLSAQAAMSAETGDYDSYIPLPQVWQDQRHGLTAGEHLRAYLLRMEHEYLQRTERRVEVVKTISLRRLFNDAIDPQLGIGSWEAALAQLLATGSLVFKLTQLLFDRDYPGHYCRQISSVEMDFAVLTGPFEDVRATLLQIGSMTTSRASVQSVQYLHNPDPDVVAPSDLLFNLRPGQQIALSVGIADNGMTAVKPDEGLLYPFENTGVVSTWELKWPWHKEPRQEAMLRSMNDCILRIRYSSKCGDQSFTDSVKELVNAAQERLAGKGVRNHE
ncbi:neuraminidase-like domain-containing protein [Pseudomonas sp. Irchel 3H7]|uniref:Tc toxin subunit A-related protein n=1 Tax=Pseudomonas sp. Irchel 3H7 TaxID=2009042 RepID=UPI000BA40CCA|nr:neuraminidase-like domain-containing protein [Pseudomonas sp. Irchel 3H7]